MSSVTPAKPYYFETAIISSSVNSGSEDLAPKFGRSARVLMSTLKLKIINVASAQYCIRSYIFATIDDYFTITAFFR